MVRACRPANAQPGSRIFGTPASTQMPDRWMRVLEAGKGVKDLGRFVPRQLAGEDGAEDDVGRDVGGLLVNGQDIAVGMQPEAGTHRLGGVAHEREHILDARLLERGIHHLPLLPPALAVGNENAIAHQQRQHRPHHLALGKAVALGDQHPIDDGGM